MFVYREYGTSQTINLFIASLKYPNSTPMINKLM